MPRGVEFDESTLTDSYGKMIVQPLEKGFGTTLGNSLRRVLLSSLQGAAAVFTRIEGVEHEFSTVPGVREDVTEIVLNLKSLEFRYDGEEIRKGRLEVGGEKHVTAADFVFEPDVELLNPDQYIATVNKGASLSMEIGIMCGRGYVMADQHKLEEQPLGTIRPCQRERPDCRLDHHHAQPRSDAVSGPSGRPWTRDSARSAWTRCSARSRRSATTSRPRAWASARTTTR